MNGPADAHPGRPAAPPPAGSATPPPGGPTPPPSGPPGAVPPPAGGEPTPSGGTSESRTPLVVAVSAVALAVVLIAAAVVVFVVSSDEAAAEVFLEAASAPGPDPFFTEARADVVETPQATSTTTPTTTNADTPSSTRSVSGGAPGLYGGTQNQAVCDPEEQADFLVDNPLLAAAFVDALNADPTLRWSGGDRLAPEEIAIYLRELTPVTLTSDTRVTNHGYRNGRPTPRQAVLQRGTAVLVDAFGVPRVKCACGNPLTRPTPLPTRPAYVGPRWNGFSPNTVVVITEVTVQIDVFVLIDVDTGEGFTRPAGTTGGGDAPVGPPEPPATVQTTPPQPEPTTPTTGPQHDGDLGSFCEQFRYYDVLWWDSDPSLAEVAAGLRDLESRAPADIIDTVNTVALFLEQQAAAGVIDVDIDEHPEVLAVFLDLLSYANERCGMDFELDW